MSSQGWGRIGAGFLAAVALSCGDDPSRPPGDGPDIDPVAPLGVTEVDTRTVPVRAVDPAGGPVTLGLSGAPAFATLADSGKGNGTLVLSPALGDAGSHMLTVTAAGASGTASLDVSVSVAAVTRAAGGLFYEPPSFCLAGAAIEDTLTLYNRSDASLIVNPIETVPGADALNQRRVLDPHSYVDVPSTWDPPGPYPRTDTLVALTNDPRRPRLVLPLRREDPAGFTDFIAPSPPLLDQPEDGAVFTLVENPDTMAPEAEIVVVWSRVDDCSGIDHYQLQVALDAGFNDRVLDVPVTDTAAVVVAEDGDQGTAYWRVLCVDTNGFTSVASEVRSWTVTGP